MAKQWTDADISTLRTMYIAGMTHNEIARILGRSPAACQQRAHQMGLPKMRKQQQQNVSETLTSQDVGNRLNEISLAATQPKPKPAWWSAMMWWRK